MIHPVTASVQGFIARLENHNTLFFAETMAVIDANFDFTPTAFINGTGQDAVINSPDQNQGSCKLFAFAKMNQLNETETLAAFGEYYRHVLANPAGNDHLNIRHFIRDGWRGIKFAGVPLQKK
jgi:hypothetical protein